MDTEAPTLVSNGFSLSNSPSRLGRLQPTDPDRSRAQLWEQYETQGYLWLKGLLDRKQVLDFRRRYFETFRDVGMLAAGSDAEDGISCGEEIGRADVQKRLMEIVRWAAYEAFCLSAPIWQFYEMFFEGAPYLHKRKLIRHGLPNDPACTGAHYDLVYLRGGTDRICTSWIPIGDTSVAMGGLIYLEGSHRWGRRKEAEFAESSKDLPPKQRISAYHKDMDTGWLGKDLAKIADQIDSRWLVADYEAGDMVVHGPYTIHASTMNVDAQKRIRLSTDIRYQRVRDEIDVRWNNHWSFDDML